MSDTVFEIIENHLKDSGFDGLYHETDYNEMECSCRIGDLAPCGQIEHSCRPGYEIPCDCGLGCGSHIGTKEEGSANG